MERLKPRVLRGHRVFSHRGGPIGWRERRRRAYRKAAQFRAHGRWADIPEERLPVQRFTITPDSVWSQPGGYSADLACAVSEPRAEESDAA